MNPPDRKAAIAAYKERKIAAGIYAIRCAPLETTWVGSWHDIETIRTRIWFSLRQGNSTKADLQAAWRAHGESAFSFEVLERLPTDVPDFARAHRLKDRTRHWIAALAARPY